jgi:hypothetical protein
MQDSDYFPYNMTGLDAWVYDNRTDQSRLAGHVESSYFGRKDALASCNALANETAQSMHLNDWGYVCCTTTSSSSCVTKVR